MKFFLPVFLLFWLAFSGCETTTIDRYLVVEVSDGDSIVVRSDQNVTERVRLATIDAPEKGQAFGAASKKSLAGLIFGKYVRITTGKRDQYGRIVSEVFVDDTNINIEQIRLGFAWHYKAYSREQNDLQRERYAAAETSAKQQRLGLWQDENPTPPWLFRKEKRNK